MFLNWLRDVPNSQGKVVSDPGNPFFKTVDLGGDTTITYRDWTCVNLDLSNHVGETLTIFFRASDCKPAGHFGYAYIDALCEGNNAITAFNMPSTACLSDPSIIMDAAASNGEDRYFLSIEESDINGGRNPSTEVMEWIMGQQAGQVDLKQWYASKGRTFKCNTYYRITLFADNGCSDWNPVVKLLYIRCPVIDAGPDRVICCNDESVPIGTEPVAGNTYVWTSIPSQGNTHLIF